jgi:predicted dehydrogenase
MALQVGVIGVGVMGRRHAENVAAQAPRARLAAVADVSAARAEQVGRALDCDWYSDPHELLTRPDIRAVIIASAAETHAPLTIAAAALGKDILCEKPPALDLRGARDAADAAQRAGVRLQIGFMRRYDPAYREAYECIERGEIGRPVLLNAISRDAEPPPRAYFTSLGTGSLFIESAIHDFDLARWLMRDEVATVSATGALLACHDLADVQPIDFGLAIIRFQQGAMGTVEGYRKAVYGYDIRTEVVGTEGTLLIGDHRWRPAEVLRADGIRHRMPAHWLDRFADAYALEVADWVERMSTDRPPAITAEDGVGALAIAAAANESMVSGKPITLSGEP